MSSHDFRENIPLIHKGTFENEQYIQWIVWTDYHSFQINFDLVKILNYNNFIGTILNLSKLKKNNAT